MEKLELSDETYRDFIDWLSSQGYSYNTIRQYKHTLKQIQLNYRKLDNNVLRKVIKKFHHQNQRAVLHAINNYCFDKGYEFRLLIPKLKTKPRKNPELYSLEEIKIMVDSAPYPYNLALRCIFNIGAGLRVSEIFKLSWNHIKWADWIKDKENYGVATIKSSKGSKDRVVNIPSNLMKDLYEMANRKGILNEFGIPKGGVVFPFRYERRKQKEFKPKLRQNNVERWKEEYVKFAYDHFRYHIIQKHCEKALGKKIKVHGLRHVRATYLYEIEKVPIERIQLLLGHSDLSTTMIYTKVNPVSTFEMLKKTKEI